MTEFSTPYVRFQNVSVNYANHPALTDVSLEVERGEFVFLVGRTGAGKSTLLKLLTKEVDAADGAIEWDGTDIRRVGVFGIPKLRRSMGIVPQDFALLPRKKVWENLAYAMRAAGATRRQIRRRVPEILERVNMVHRADAYPDQLSGGEQQRVAIGRALVNDPPLLLADEPTGNLDPEHSIEIMELLVELNRKGTTVLVASHDVLVIERLRKRTVTLSEGRIVSDSKTDPVVQPMLDLELEPEVVAVEIPVAVETPTSAAPQNNGSAPELGAQEDSSQHESEGDTDPLPISAEDIPDEGDETAPLTKEDDRV